jgi:hypothetical protein
MAKKPDLDAPTLRIMKRMMNMLPKPHEEMKLGKPKGKSKKSLSHKKKVAPKRS